METDRNPPVTSADGAILSMPNYRRKMMFERTVNDLARLSPSASDYQNRQEGLLIGGVLRMRRLGVTPEGFRISLAESETGDALTVAIQRGTMLPQVYTLMVEREGRTEELSDILTKTIRSFRNNGKPRGKAAKL